MATYSIVARPVNAELRIAIARESLGEEETFILIDDTDRLDEIEKIQDEEVKQMKLQTLYLYSMATGKKCK